MLAHQDLRSTSRPALRDRAHIRRYTSQRHVRIHTASYTAALANPSWALPTPLTPGNKKRELRTFCLERNNHRICIKGCEICFPPFGGEKRARKMLVRREGSEQTLRRDWGEDWTLRRPWEMAEAEYGCEVDDGGVPEERAAEADWGAVVDMAVREWERKKAAGAASDTASVCSDSSALADLEWVFCEYSPEQDGWEIIGDELS